MTLFDFAQRDDSKNRPLADRMRPRSLDEFFGQEHIVGKGRLLRRAIEIDRLTSSIFWGPPGTGKTTLANVIAQVTKSAFERMNAVTSGVADVREVLKQAQDRQKMYGKSTYLLLDECHRWSKAQSDSILPAIEKGIIKFIGSTTENPMVSMTPAIVSRCRLFEFKPLNQKDIENILLFALKDTERGLGKLNITIDNDALKHLVFVSNGDARMALNALELAALTTPTVNGTITITLDIAQESIQKPVLRMDDNLYYDMLSAFCKSLRGSDSDAALLWFSRLLYSGCDPMLLARRIIAHASEDVGLANPEAMVQAVSAAQALKLVGMPEARLSLTQAIIAVCESPKSNSVVIAMEKSMADAQKGDLGAVPMHLRDTHYKGAEKTGAGQGYLYPHDYEGHYIEQNYMPEGFEDTVYYKPGKLGFEKNIKKQKDR
ncbi:MAG: replication-associated recombination protein A [Eubacteriales bacterium]|nr:replication-associated recombination protein A [Eubacteriales bacterium]